MKSGAFKKEYCEAHGNEYKGRTYYLYGKQGFKGERLVRYYDYRGPVRFEYELNEGIYTGNREGT